DKKSRKEKRYKLSNKKVSLASISHIEAHDNNKLTRHTLGNTRKIFHHSQPVVNHAWKEQDNGKTCSVSLPVKRFVRWTRWKILEKTDKKGLIFSLSSYL